MKPASGRRKSLRLWGLVGCGVLLLLPPSYLLALFARCMGEQILWYPRDDSEFRLVGYEYSEKGIALEVYSRLGVRDVWRTGVSWWLWEPQHHRVPFWRISRQDGHWTILVEYPYHADGEWILAMQSLDGYWWSASPYFFDPPTISDEEWLQLQTEAWKVEVE